MTRRELLSTATVAGLNPGKSPASQAGRPESRLTAVHVLVESPPWSPGLGEHWDPRRFVAAAREAGVGIIEQKTKNEHGHALFPFQGRPCPHDWVTATRAECGQAGLPYVAYYNVGLDNWMARQKPDWTCRDAEGKPLIAFGAYNWMCFRSPWHDLVLDELRQVVKAVHPDAVWFDLLGAPNAYGPGSFDPALACRCEYCRKAYRQTYGEDMPGPTTLDPELRWRLNRFGHQSRIRMLSDASKLVRSLDAKAWLGSNGAGFWDALAGTPDDVKEYITFNSSEAKDHRGISFKSKMMWSLGKPFQIHSYGGFSKMEPGSAVGTWVAWNLIPAEYMRISTAVAAAHGGRISVGVNPLPDGNFQTDELKRLGAGFDSANARAPWLVGLKSIPNIGIIYDGPSELAFMRQPGPRLRVQQETMGLHHALLEAGMHFDILDSGGLSTNGYSALILGDAPCSDEKLLPALKSYVEGGGLLVVTAETSLRDRLGKRLPNFSWSDFLGIRFTGISPFQEANFGWLGQELRASTMNYPMLFRVPPFEVQATTAAPLAELVYPAAHRTKDVFTDGETGYTHYGQRTGKPLITRNRLGKGSVVYIGVPLGREIATRNDPWLKRLLARTITAFGMPLSIRTKVPPGVQVVFGRTPAAHVISLVNHYAGLVVPAEERSPLQVGPVQVEVPIRVFGRAPAKVQAMDARNFAWRVEKDTLRMTADAIGHHALLIIS